MKIALKVIGIIVLLFVLISAILFFLVWQGYVDCNLFHTFDAGPDIIDSPLCPVIESFMNAWIILSKPFSAFF
jgi:hypothetical protein